MTYTQDQIKQAKPEDLPAIAAELMGWKLGGWNNLDWMDHSVEPPRNVMRSDISGSGSGPIWNPHTDYNHAMMVRDACDPWKFSEQISILALDGHEAPTRADVENGIPFERVHALQELVALKLHCANAETITRAACLALMESKTN